MSEGRKALIASLWRLPWRERWGERLEAAIANAPPPVRGGERWLLRMAMLCLLVGVTILLVCGYHGGFLRLNTIATAYPSWVWSWLTSLGNERVAFALTLFFSLRAPRLFWTLIVAGLIAILYSRGLKELFDAMRPPAVLAADAFHLIGPAHQRHGFPSGHSVTAGVFFGVLIVQARWIELRILWTLLAVLVGLSRIAVGVHWPVDVAFGLAGGVLAALLGSWLAARWPGSARRLWLHLVAVTIAAGMAFSLMLDDGGYSQATLILRALGTAAILSAAFQYVLQPALRARGGGNHV